METISLFARTHVPQITATVGLVTYATTRNKLTLDGIFAGIVVAILHMLHPWPAFFWLLILFFLFGTLVTKIGHARKSHLTLSSTGGSGGEGARSSAQVLANSGFASVLILAHAILLNSTPFISSQLPVAPGPAFPTLQRVLPIGIVAQYAAVAADTFSSELGILARGEPVLVIAPWRRVPRGTNGGVTAAGLAFGALGSALLTLVAAGTLWAAEPHRLPSTSGPAWALLTALGLCGSVLDSVLGALVQATVTDAASGKVVEGPGGTRVSVAPGGSRTRVGRDLLSNNGVNFVMAAGTAVLGMLVAWVWEVELV